MNWKQGLVLFFGILASTLWGLVWFTGCIHETNSIILVLGWTMIVIPTAGLVDYYTSPHTHHVAPAAERRGKARAYSAAHHEEKSAYRHVYPAVHSKNIHAKARAAYARRNAALGKAERKNPR